MSNQEKTEREAFVKAMEQFVGKHTMEWAQKAKSFIQKLKKELYELSAEAFKAALLRWDELVDKAPKKVWVAYATSPSR